MDFVLTNGGKNSHSSTKKIPTAPLVVTGALQMVGKIPTAQQRKFPQLPCFSESCQQLPFSVVHWVSRRKDLCKCCTKDSWWKVGGGASPPYFNYWHPLATHGWILSSYWNSSGWMWEGFNPDPFGSMYQLPRQLRVPAWIWKVTSKNKWAGEPD